jgi:hypothetical protein
VVQFSSSQTDGKELRTKIINIFNALRLILHIYIYMFELNWYDAICCY